MGKTWCIHFSFPVSLGHEHVQPSPVKKKDDCEWTMRWNKHCLFQKNTENSQRYKKRSRKPTEKNRWKRTFFKWYWKMVKWMNRETRGKREDTWEPVSFQRFFFRLYVCAPTQLSILISSADLTGLLFYRFFLQSSCFSDPFCFSHKKCYNGHLFSKYLTADGVGVRWRAGFYMCASTKTYLKIVNIIPMRI